MKDVKISVIIPCYNRLEVIKRSVQSVISQNFTDFEIIIVDDNSTEDINSVVLQIDDARLRLIKNNSKKGAQGARITGMLEAKGKYIVFLDSDDELTSGSLQQRINYRENVIKEPALIYGDVMRNSSRTFYLALQGNVYNTLLKELSLCPFSVMFVDKECIEKSGLPSDDFPSWQDDDFILTIGKKFPMFHCGDIYAKMYDSGDSISINRNRIYQGCKMLVNKYAKEMVNNVGMVRLFLWRIRLLSYWFDALAQNNKAKFIGTLKPLGISLWFLFKIIAKGLKLLIKPFFKNYYV
jgi:glycosyltransferase involved in cell wall biosynthesis